MLRPRIAFGPEARRDPARHAARRGCCGLLQVPVTLIKFNLARVDALGVVARSGQQQPVERAAPGELLVRALGDQASVIEDRDLVGKLEGGPAVRDQQRGSSGHHLAQGRVDLGLDACVDRGRGVVEHQDRRVGDERPGQRDALALAAGQGKSLLADDGVVAVRQFEDEFLGLGGTGRGDDLCVRGVGPAVGDVVRHGVGEQEALFQYQADRGAQRVDRDVADVVPADPDRAGPHVVEPREEQGDGRLTGAGGADYGQRLARPDPQRQAAQDRLGRQVAEMYVVKLDVLGTRGQHQRAGLLSQHRPRVDHLEDPDHAGPRLLPDRDQVGEGADRVDHLGQVGGKRQEGTEGDLALDGHPAAEREHAYLAERRDGAERRAELGHEPDRPDPRRVQHL